MSHLPAADKRHMSTNNVLPFPAPARRVSPVRRSVLVPFPAPAAVNAAEPARPGLTGRVRRLVKDLSIAFRNF